MKFKHLTWYILADGTNADPNDVSPGDDGVLRHTSGMAVALHEDGTPMSVGVAAEENKNVEAAEAGNDAAEAAEQQAVTEAAAVEVNAESPEPVVTEVDPATGQKAEPVETEVREVVAKPKKPAKNRAMKPGPKKTYQTR